MQYFLIRLVELSSGKLSSVQSVRRDLFCSNELLLLESKVYCELVFLQESKQTLIRPDTYRIKAHDPEFHIRCFSAITFIRFFPASNMYIFELMVPKCFFEKKVDLNPSLSPCPFGGL